MKTILRFINAQRNNFATALKEIKNGEKQTHWIWFIFPQLKSLGYSDMAKFYGIRDLKEARQYLENDYLRNNLIAISEELCKHKGKLIQDIVGEIDAKKIQSCMTLFLECEKVKTFETVLKQFYNNEKCKQTLTLLGLEKGVAKEKTSKI